jgi:hypothetical protein
MSLPSLRRLTWIGKQLCKAHEQFTLLMKESSAITKEPVDEELRQSEQSGRFHSRLGP